LLAEQQLRLQLDDAAVEALVDQGYEPEYGARPLRRVLRRRIENPLATELLADRFLGAWGVAIEAEGQELRFVPLRQEAVDVR
jgi:ATP-dependent Clp protease ATP-binding subunit ClpA